MKTCPRCAAENRDDQGACWNCWAPLEGGEVGAAAPAEEVRVRRGVPLKPILIIVLILVIAFVAYQFLGGPGPVKVANDYLDAQYNGRETLAAEVTAQETAGRPLLPPLLKVGKYDLDMQQQPTIMGDRAEVATQVSFRLDLGADLDPAMAAPGKAALAELKKSLLTRVVLAKQGGKWKVDQLATSQAFTEDAGRRFKDDKAWIAGLFKGQPLTSAPGSPAPARAAAPGPPPPPVAAPSPAPPPPDDDDD
jgi:hypothetical protein